MGTTTRIVVRVGDLYETIHVSMSGYPAGVGRRLLDHVDTPKLARGLIETAEGRDSRQMYSFPAGVPDLRDFTRGGRDMSIAAFAPDELGSKMPKQSFFLHDGEVWRWMGADGHDEAEAAAAAGTPLGHDAVLALMTPLAEAVEEDERPAREGRQRHLDAIAKAASSEFLPGETISLEDRDGTCALILRRGDEVETLTPQKAARAAHSLMLLASEAEERNRKARVLAESAA